MDAHRFSQISGMDLWDGKARPPAPVENLCPIPGCSRPLRTFRFTRISLDFSYMFKDFGHWFLVLWRLSSYFTAFHKLPEIPLIFKDFHRFRACMRAADPPPPVFDFCPKFNLGDGISDNVILYFLFFTWSLGPIRGDQNRHNENNGRRHALQTCGHVYFAHWDVGDHGTCS